jgi:hypothetical protein
MSRVKSIAREARDYDAREAARVAPAVALIVGSPLSRMIGNFFLGLNRTAVPIRLFTSEPAARSWLRRYLRDRAEA